VYAGHAAIATFVKAKRPKLALALLVPVAFAPDWIELFADALNQHNRLISHSLVSIGIGATLVAAIFALVTREIGNAGWIWMTYVSHWLADFITGHKPTWPGGPEVGLGLYDRGVWDVVLEAALVLICWLIYRRTLPSQSRGRRLVWLVPITLIVLQIFVHAASSLPF
jgi:hypothetical protein